MKWRVAPAEAESTRFRNGSVTRVRLARVDSVPGWIARGLAAGVYRMLPLSGALSSTTGRTVSARAICQRSNCGVGFSCRVSFRLNTVTRHHILNKRLPHENAENSSVAVSICALQRGFSLRPTHTALYSPLHYCCVTTSLASRALVATGR